MPLIATDKILAVMAEGGHASDSRLIRSNKVEVENEKVVVGRGELGGDSEAVDVLQGERGFGCEADGSSTHVVSNCGAMSSMCLFVEL